nr:hypothetical protein BaRGS_000443 [Batillaria attramentaria]
MSTVLGNLTAIDTDGPSPLTFRTETTSTFDLVELSSVRNVDPFTWAVDIILKAQLDRDYAPNERKLYFTISDGSSDIPAKISLFIRDVNDVKPQFTDLPYKATINESVEQGTVVFRGVRASDPDNGRGGTVSYNMTTEAQGADEEYRTTFAINEYDGTITLTRKLDYEKHSFYQFKINAMDGGGLQAEPTDFVVTVLDVQDTAPKFGNLPYSTGIAEDISVGASVLQVVGFDQDLGIPNDLSYSFVRGDYENFEIDPTTGWITVKNPLDRDSDSMSSSGGVYAMYVQASEVVPPGQQNFGNTTAEEIVTITVLDVNDNVPTFSESVFQAQIQENMQNGVPVTFLTSFMRVFDHDQGTNSHFSLSLEQNGQPYTDFTTLPAEVYSESTVLIRVQNSEKLDYEKEQQIVFQVVAREIDTKEKKSGTATVTLSILDMNDNAPNFTSPSYVFPVAEDAAVDTSIGAIFAADDDSGSYGSVSYSIRGGNGKFRVDSLTGDLYVNGELDREATSEYFLSAEAIDGGGLRAPSEIQIIVTDVNDRPPLFRRRDYEGVAREKATTFLRPIIVEAIDDDEPNTPNSQVQYRIDRTPQGLESNFTIDANTGEISLEEPLDYEKLDTALDGRVVLEVTAYDAGAGQLSSTVFVNITVEDINDFAPVFFPLTYTKTISENSAEGTSVVAVTATDQDGTSPNNDFFYRIENGALDKFRMDFETGVISVEASARLDREEKQEYILRVSATDRGNSPLTGYCDVTIKLDNVNDELPVFARTSETITRSENLAVGQSVFTYSATDSDDDSSLEYSLLKDETKAFDENGEPVVDTAALGVNNYFDVFATNGTIFVSSQLDRETVERIVIKILVKDINAQQPPEQSATATLTVTLADYNDNAPRFVPSDQFQVNVSEAEGVNSVILRVDTVDPDKGQDVTYELASADVDPDGVGFFRVDSSTGIVFLQQKLDRETKPSHVFVIIAKDDGDPQQSSSATVSITVTDVNDNMPEFIAYNSNVDIPEDVNTGYEVITMQAKDKDAGDFGKVVYSLEGVDSDDGNFQIHPDTGVVTVVKQLDRETKKLYRLEVLARDSAPDVVDQKSKRTPLTITVTDVNDNEPQFESIGPSHPKISESLQRPETVFTVKASDADEGPNGMVEYTLTDSTNATTTTGDKLFSIGRATGVVTVNQPLHGLAGLYFITVKAADKGSPVKFREQQFVIEVYDVNDAYPEFIQPNPDNPLTVQEGQDPGILVVKLVAEDTDTGQNGLVSYSLVPDQDPSVLQNFHVNASTGDLTTLTSLDRERKAEYEVRVRASDHGIPQNHSRDMTLIVKVLDTNDQPPMFDRNKVASPYVVRMAENENVGQNGKQQCPNVTVAEDKDSDPENAIICYYLFGAELTGVFRLYTSGQLCLEPDRVLDREQTDTTNIVIKASENCYEDITPLAMIPSGSSAPSAYDPDDTSLLWVQIKVNDKNDNPPVFNRGDLAIGITRDIQLGQIIINLKNEVSDADSTLWGVADRFENLTAFEPHPKELADALVDMGVNTPFRLFPNGSVKVNTYFNADMSGYFSVRVKAVDKGGRSAEAQLRISLISDSQRLKVVFRESLGVADDYKNEFARRMTEVTGYRIVVDKIQTHESENSVAESDKTDMFIHGEDMRTNEIVPAVNLLRHIDQLSANAQMVSVLNEFNILEIVETTVKTADNERENKLQMALILVSVILGVLCIILAVSLYFTYKRYSRKLKAATAMAYGPQEADLYKVDIPGTNMHSYENSNPIYLEKIMLEGDDDGQNSLDENALTRQPLPPFDEQEVCMNIYPENHRSRNQHRQNNNHSNNGNNNNNSNSTSYLKAVISEHETSQNFQANDVDKDRDDDKMMMSLSPSPATASTNSSSGDEDSGRFTLQPPHRPLNVGVINAALDDDDEMGTRSINGLPSTEI